MSAPHGAPYEINEWQVLGKRETKLNGEKWRAKQSLSQCFNLVHQACNLARRSRKLPMRPAPTLTLRATQPERCNARILHDHSDPGVELFGAFGFSFIHAPTNACFGPEV